MVGELRSGIHQLNWLLTVHYKFKKKKVSWKLLSVNEKFAVNVNLFQINLKDFIF